MWKRKVPLSCRHGALHAITPPHGDATANPETNRSTQHIEQLREHLTGFANAAQILEEFDFLLNCNQTEHSIQKPIYVWTLNDDPLASPHFEYLVLTGKAGFSCQWVRHMTSQWEKLCAILELSEKMQAKHKAAYLQSALAALAFESHANMATRHLRSVKSKMQAKSNGQSRSKKRRSAI